MSENKIPYKIYLTESEIPDKWYNVRADMKNKPAPLLNPGTLEPMTAQELSGVFCEELVAQELNNTDRYIDIDTGSSYEGGRLSMLCIDDGKVFSM